MICYNNSLMKAQKRAKPPSRGATIILGTRNGLRRFDRNGCLVDFHKETVPMRGINSIVQNGSGVIYHSSQVGVYRTHDNHKVFDNPETNFGCYAFIWNGSLHIAVRLGSPTHLQVLDKNMKTVIDSDVEHLHLGLLHVAEIDSKHLALPLQHYWINIADRKMKKIAQVGWGGGSCWTDLKNIDGHVYISTDDNHIYRIKGTNTEIGYDLRAVMPLIYEGQNRDEVNGLQNIPVDPHVEGVLSAGGDVCANRQFIVCFDIFQDIVYFVAHSLRENVDRLVRYDPKKDEVTCIAEDIGPVTSMKVVQET